MIKKAFVALMMSVAVSQASVEELVPNLSSKDLEVQNKARFELFDACSNAGRPGADAERKAISQELCQVLANDIPMSAMNPIIRNLQRIGGVEAVPTLAKLLNHKNEIVRDDARRALAVNPSPAAGKTLAAQLKMRKARNARETAGLIQALGERRETGASNLIAGYLVSKDDRIFIAAVKALGRLNEVSGIRALAERRRKERGFRLVQINAALFRTDRLAVFEKLYADSEPETVRAVALLGLVMNNGLNVAASAMASGNPVLQSAVIEGASQRCDPKLYSLVATSLKTLPSHLQLQALGVLEFSGSRDYAKAVEPLLKSPDIFVQDNTARALARIGTADSVPALMANGRGDARRALGVLSVDGVDAELEKIARSSSDANSRASAIDALAIRGRRDLLPAFFKYASDDNRTTATAAAKAIGSIGEISNLDQLVELMKKQEAAPVSRDLLNASVAIMRRSADQAKAVGILVGRMDGASARSQANILQALVQTESKEALKPLADACRSTDEKLQKTAVKLLGGWKADNGIPIMLELAGDDSIELANHVVLMRGVSRLLAAENPRRLNMELANQALETCRRDEEKQAIQATLDKAKK